MNALTQALSAALIHMIWQGALIGWVFWIALIVLKNWSAQARYAVNCVALSVLAITLVVSVAGVVYLHASSRMWGRAAFRQPRLPSTRMVHRSSQRFRNNWD